MAEILLEYGNIDSSDLDGVDADTKIGILLHQGPWRIHSSLSAMSRSFRDDLRKLGLKVVEIDGTE